MITKEYYRDISGAGFCAAECCVKEKRFIADNDRISTDASGI